MKTMTYDEFVHFYHDNGRCVNQIQKPNHELSNQELQSRYNKYVKSEQKKEEKKQELIEKQKQKSFNKQEEVDLQLEEAYKKVDVRDKGKCQLINKLTREHFKELCSNAWKEMLDTIDHAHVFGKGPYPELKYDPNNIVLLNRYSHSMLDQYRHPLNGSQITDQEKIHWWIFIIGGERYNILKAKLQKE
jgi:hypothetical protein